MILLLEEELIRYHQYLIKGTRSGGSNIGGERGQCYLFGNDTSKALDGEGLSLDFDAAPHVPCY